MKYSECYNELKKIIYNELGIDMATSSKMAEAIENWAALMENNPSWESATVKGNEIPATVASEIARLTVLEFISGVQNDEAVNTIYQAGIKNIGQDMEFALGKGGCIFKPYITDNGIEVSCVQADDFFPISYSNDKISAAVFIDQMSQGKEIYTRVEIWAHSGTELKILNKAYKSNDANKIGHEIDLADVEAWADIMPEATFEAERMPFGYFRTPLANTVDNQSPLGISIFHRGIQDIQRADVRLSQIDWEYDSKESAVHISDSLLKTNADGQKVYPKGGERLYRVLDYFTGATDKPLLDVYSPTYRDISLYNGLDHIYKAIELKCYLSYGTLSDPNSTDKTAEEIRMSKQRSYTIVVRCQEALQDALEDLIYGIQFWSILAGTSPVGDLETFFSFGDSILTDKDKDRQIMLQEVSAGIRSKASYLMEVYGITEDAAAEIIPQQAGLFEGFNA